MQSPSNEDVKFHFSYILNIFKYFCLGIGITSRYTVYVNCIR